MNLGVINQIPTPGAYHEHRCALYACTQGRARVPPSAGLDFCRSRPSPAATQARARWAGPSSGEGPPLAGGRKKCGRQTWPALAGGFVGPLLVLRAVKALSARQMEE